MVILLLISGAAVGAGRRSFCLLKENSQINPRLIRQTVSSISLLRFYHTSSPQAPPPASRDLEETSAGPGTPLDVPELDERAGSHFPPPPASPVS